jgi:metal-sulfur cluster biosynthetic enzyme
MTPIRYEDHTDGVREKLRLLEAAYAAGKLDLAMSLAEAAKETLAFERQQEPRAAQSGIAADQFVPVADLPKPWAAWARGWKFCKPVTLFETVGVERSGEPVELDVAFPLDETTDLGRELRVAQLDASTGVLRQIACQVDDELRHGKERHCRLVFVADVAAHRQATYFVFYGNPWAERPGNATDLCVRGEGYGLDVENHHFTARLSRQMGQLERLTYKRQHGLELYAGGKGHGEPPGIDWAHDYVDAGHFQKLRMRNWPACPNYEVVHGPIRARIRRWGFPYSPVHPVFAPARVHMDQQYAFYAGLPYFLKEGSIDVVKDVEIAAMRDDEWVFSGYSFTDMVWFDEQGKLHEGDVPADSVKKLWGVGFYNRTSHDAFIALWLEHEAHGFDLPHGGPPTLHYAGHGQLWSRYPAEEARLKAGTSFRQKNAYLVSPYEGPDAAAKVEQLRHQLLNPLEARAGELPRTPAVGATVALARSGETRETASLKPAIWKALAEVRDEQLYKIDSSVVDLGYVYDVRERDGLVSILVTMPHRGRPMYDFLVSAGGGRVEPGIREHVLKVKGVRDVVVDVTWNPPWTADRLSDAGRRAFGLPA